MVFSMRRTRKMQETMTASIYHLYRTKAFDLVSIIRSFHEDMNETIVFHSSTSDPLNINSSVKQSCILAPSLKSSLRFC